MKASFEPNIAFVIFSALNFLILIGIIVGAIWAIRRLRSISELEQRVTELEARLGQPDHEPPTA